MTDFEFLSVLISILIGFGLTHLLSGLGRAFHFRLKNKMDAVHIAWTTTIFFVFVLNWWIFLLWRDTGTWTFPTFFTIVLWTISMYTLALALYPPHLPEDVSYRDLFETNRTWFLSMFTIMCLLDILVTGQREGAIPELFYLAFVGHYALIGAIGIVFRNRTYDLVAAWYIAATMMLWSFGVRGTLG